VISAIVGLLGASSAQTTVSLGAISGQRTGSLAVSSAMTTGRPAEISARMIVLFVDLIEMVMTVLGGQSLGKPTTALPSSLMMTGDPVLQEQQLLPVVSVVQIPPSVDQPHAARNLPLRT
jgi:hypothetical protein